MPNSTTRILVAESDPILRMLIVSTLNDAGYEAFEAPTGDRALDLLDEPDNIHLIVTSIQLAGTDGIEIAQRARTHGAPIPVVFASGSGDRLVDASAPGGMRRLHKPYTIAQLHEAIVGLLTETHDDRLKAAEPFECG